MCTRFFVRPALIAAAFVSSFAVGTDARAEVQFDWVTVGNAGNAADSTGFGAVGYEYKIAQTEVTNAQYAEFLNAKAATDTLNLFPSTVGSFEVNRGITQSGSSGSYSYAVKPNMADKPATFISWYTAARFVNWLHNGQGSADTESGAYTLLGGAFVPTNEGSITRNPGAKFHLPSEDEWYKAAYHQPANQGGDGDDYWLYPTASNSAPTTATATAVGDIANPGTNVANYQNTANWNGTTGGNVTTVGSAGGGSASFYGTFDQGGNVAEWNESLFVVPGTDRLGLRGGSFFPNPVDNGLPATSSTSLSPRSPNNNVGFRVAAPIPEPTSLALLALGAPALMRRRRG